jgi:hypothetical protein
MITLRTFDVCRVPKECQREYFRKIQMYRPGAALLLKGRSAVELDESREQRRALLADCCTVPTNLLRMPCTRTWHLPVTNDSKPVNAPARACCTLLRLPMLQYETTTTPLASSTFASFIISFSLASAHRSTQRKYHYIHHQSFTLSLLLLELCIIFGPFKTM